MSHGVILFALGHIKRHTSMRIFTLNIYLGYPTNYRIGYPGNKLPGYGSLKCIYGDGLALVAVCVCVLYDVDALRLNACRVGSWCDSYH